MWWLFVGCLLVDGCLLVVTRVVIVRCVLFVVWCRMLFAFVVRGCLASCARCLLMCVVGSVLFAVCCVLCVVRHLLYVACCCVCVLRCVVRCGLRVAGWLCD